MPNDHIEMLTAIPHFDGSSCVNIQQANGLDLPTFAINLAHRTDRWDALQHRFGMVGIDRITRVPAINGATISSATLSLFTGDVAESINAPPASHLSLTRPAVGCFLSHLSVWKWVAASGLPCVMVVEDDAIPTLDFDASLIGTAIQSFSGNSILFPGCTVMSGLVESSQQNGLARVY